ncbi:MAG: flagellar brake protein [Eubacterium sp.]|nr:flagellar brake protein [Eubacterium sp.]
MEKVFAIGDKIEITPVKSAFSYDRSVKKYSSQMLDFDDVRTAKIVAPIQEGRLVPLRIDEDIDLCFFTKAGLYQCRGRIKNRYMDNRVSVLDVLFVSDPQKFQRRKFYRLECTFDINYRRLSKEEIKLREDMKKAKSLGDTAAFESRKKELEELPQTWQTATITNLSGGGVRFHLRERLDAGEQIEVAIPLSMQNGVMPMKFMAHVIDCDQSDDSREKATDARCEFDGVTNREREMIVKYVFEEQRRRMSGGER